MAKQTLLEQERGSVGSVRLLSICKALSSILNKEAKHNCSHPIWAFFQLSPYCYFLILVGFLTVFDPALGW